jgi:hypothetical protein
VNVSIEACFTNYKNKGYRSHIRVGRCGDNRVVGLSRKGYLEKFGFLHKIGNFQWQVCQKKLLSEDMALCSDSNEKISISPQHMEITARKEPEKTTHGVVSVNRKLEEEDTEKERNFVPKIYRNEDRVFNAVPFAEPDRTKTNLRKASKNG